MLNEEQHDTVLESIPYMALGVIRDSQLVLPIVNVAYYIYIYIYILPSTCHIYVQQKD